jgi:CHAT domain-containing protein
MKRFLRWFFLGFLSFFLIINLSPVHSQTNVNPRELVAQGQQLYEKGEISGAIALLQQAQQQFREQEKFSSLAITLTNLGQLQLLAGQSEAAIETWQSAMQLQVTSQNPSLLQRLQINRATALREMGMYARSCQELTGVLEISSNICSEETLQETVLSEIDPNSVLRKGWRNLADTLRVLGKPQKARSLLSDLNEQLPASVEKDTVLLSLGETLQAIGNTERDRAIDVPLYDYLPWQCQTRELSPQAKQSYQQAKQFYQQASQSGSPYLRNQALLRQFSLIQDTAIVSPQSAPKIDFSALNPGRERIYAQIDFAKSEACLAQLQGKEPHWNRLIQLTQTGIEEAQRLGDDRAQAYALGTLGGLYEYRANVTQQQKWADMGQKLTTQALYLAQPETEPDLAYQWQWQQGRLLARKGEIAAAIPKLQAAAKTLEQVRTDLRAIDADVQFSFRDQVEPLYRQLIDLLSQQDTPEALEQALSFLDALQLAELENFLDCNLSESVAVEQILETLDPQAAFIAPIILKDRLEVIYKLPQQPLAHHSTPVAPQEVDAVVDRIRKSLVRPDRSFAVVEEAKTLYDWLIRPLEPSLNAAPNVETLVFVSDSSLRNVPPSVFHDGESFLVQTYQTAVIPSRELLATRPRETDFRVLLAGISESQQVDGIEFTPLPAVAQEIKQLQQKVASNSDTLFNQEFTQTRLQEKIDQLAFPAVHIATHGKFSSEPEDTYLLAWQERILVKELDSILQISRPQFGQTGAIDLLVLSACETAQGNRRAALGLAGISAQAQVRSTIATLWQVDDRATALLMNKFYEELNEDKTIATALRNAQLYLIEDLGETRPFLWSPFILVGNWL